MTPVSNTTPSVDSSLVGNAFVQQYYNHLYKSPSDVHKFYLQDSLIGRAGLDGEMVYFNSLKAINDEIISIDYKNSNIQILTADSQKSLNGGVVTMVTGLVIGKDGGRKKFSQNFFLVAQKGSYFVLNDLLRYVSEEIVFAEATKKVEVSPQVTEETDIEPANEAKTTVSKPANGHAKVPKEKVVNGSSDLSKVSEEKVEEIPSKRSFAGIVAQNGGSFPTKTSPVKPKRVEKVIATPKPKAPEQASAKTAEQPAATSGSIFVANLPLDVTREQLYETFKVFGEIERNGIQVKSYPEQRNCFGFVAFENGEAVENVFKAHKETPIRIGNRRASIEKKTSKSNNNGGRPFARDNGYRPQGNGGRGYGSERRYSGATGNGNAQARI